MVVRLQAIKWTLDRCLLPFPRFQPLHFFSSLDEEDTQKKNTQINNYEKASNSMAARRDITFTQPVVSVRCPIFSNTGQERSLIIPHMDLRQLDLNLIDQCHNEKPVAKSTTFPTSAH